MTTSHATVQAARLPFVTTSRWQRLRVARERGGVMFRLNGCPQVFGPEAERYHRACATLPLCLARHARTALVLGGGDGLAAAALLAFPRLQRVTLVELDAKVVGLWRAHPELTAMNGSVFADPRLELVVGDAFGWLARCRRRFDVVVNDVEVTYTDQPRDLTAQVQMQFFQDIRRHLAPGGVAVATVPEDFDPRFVARLLADFGELLTPAARRACARTRDTLRRLQILFGVLFPCVGRHDVPMPVLGTHANFYLAEGPLRLRRQPPAPAQPFAARAVRAMFAGGPA